MNQTTSSNSSIKSASLYCRAGSKDAEYHCQLVPTDGGFNIKYQNGRRGKALTDKVKALAPMNLDEAVKAFDKLVKSKLSDGYKHAADAEIAETSQAGSTNLKATVSIPQHCNAIAEDQLEQFLNDDSYALLEKMDGHRKQVELTTPAS